MNVKYLPEAHIEGAALELLGGYSRKFGVAVAPPIPVDEILESLLDLQLELGDLAELLGVTDVLGATWVKDRRVVIDQSLDPADYPAKVGRYRFTLGHEIGHWELHRHYYADQDQPLLADGTPTPSIVCRSSRKDRQELQADSFAGCLLMPKAMVQHAWKTRFGSLEPMVVEKEIQELKGRLGVERPTVRVAKEMAVEFQVSGQAMQIKLESLGLVLAKTPPPSLFAL